MEQPVTGAGVLGVASREVQKVILDAKEGPGWIEKL
jgi:hypothetical protein